MTTDDSYIHIDVEEKSKFQIEEILVLMKDINMTINEIKIRQDNFDRRLTVLKQQHSISRISSNVLQSLSTQETSRYIPVENQIKQEQKPSTCFMGDGGVKNCTLYFDDFIGADATRVRCPYEHLIRIHQRNPNSLETNLPSFATPPFGQLLYEELVPSGIQDIN
ncbi:hypothetical protein I4U23_018305 [Adineta vaga]|nr:hypothetical protein I4U23_018305 [Adineta vaga]